MPMEDIYQPMAQLEIGESIGYKATIEGTLNLYPFNTKARETRIFKIERIR